MTDKTLINKRFIDCVNHLISDLKTENKGSIAQKISIKPAKFSEILNNRMSIGLEDLAVFSVKFGFDANWILTGRGLMLPEKEKVQYVVDSEKQDVAGEPVNYYQSELVESLKKTITILEKEVEELKDDKELLKSVIKTKMGKANAS